MNKKLVELFKTMQDDVAYSRHLSDSYLPELQELMQKGKEEYINEKIDVWSKSIEAFEPINGELYFTQKQVSDLLEALKQ